MTTIRLVSDSTTAVPQVNDNFTSVSAAGLYGYNKFLTSGLNWGYYGGRAFGNTIADGTVTLTTGTTNYIVANLSTGVVSASTSTTNWSNTANYLKLYSVVTTTSVFSFIDERQAYIGAVAAAGFANPMTTTGDLILGGAAGAPGRLGVGSAGQVLTVSGSTAAWVTPGTGGTVTSVAAQGGIETVSGSAITTSGTVQANELVNAQAGATYTYVTGDRAKLVTHSNAAAIAGTLPQAGGSFPAGWFIDVKNLGAGSLTITPTTSTIDGAATLVLASGQSAHIVSDGTNYQLSAKSGGYINVPQNSQSAAYTTVLADQGKHIFHPSADTTARTFTIDSNANVPYPIGTALTFVNQNAAGVMTIAITTDTMRLAGAGTTGSRTLAANGIATALKVTATEWIISGTGLT